MKKNDNYNWIEQIILELDKNYKNIRDFDLVVEEILDKINTLISEINSYIAETHYGLNITNENISKSLKELAELQRKLEDYLKVSKNINESFEDVYKSLLKLKDELDNIKSSFKESSNAINAQQAQIEQKLKEHEENIKKLSDEIKNIIKSQIEIKQNLKNIKLVLYITLTLLFINLIISLRLIF
ncbi:hypothetical protein ACPB8Q_03155 [Methanocaldococcus indicus]|uniref:hypothetical protein n=1 Tax=Methanocaldococcus indicus TaxID=213231 RepID=UPI003C6CF613